MESNDGTSDEDQSREHEDQKCRQNDGALAFLSNGNLVHELHVNICGQMVTISLEHKAMEDTTWTSIPDTKPKRRPE